MLDSKNPLMPTTALGGSSPKSEHFGRVQITENSDLALASVAVLGGAKPKPFGIVLPDVGQATQKGDYGAFWIGHNQWIVEASSRADSDFSRELKSKVGKALVTDQTDGYVCFDLHGPQDVLINVLNKLINIDPKRLTPGTVVRTGLEHMTVFVIRRSDDHLSVLGMRGFAGSLWHVLSVAASRSV